MSAKTVKINNINPFIEKLDIETICYVVKQKHSKDPLQLHNDNRLPDYQRVSYAEFGDKTTITNRDKLSPILERLSPVGSKLLLFILFKLGKDTSKINLSNARLKKELNIEKSSSSSARSELSKLDLIQKFRKDEYWINPLYFWSGNKVKHFREKDRAEDLGIPDNKRNDIPQELTILGDRVITIRQFKLFDPDGSKRNLKGGKFDSDLDKFLNSAGNLEFGINPKVSEVLDEINDILNDPFASKK